MFFLFLLLVATSSSWSATGTSVHHPGSPSIRSPEGEAKRILAERFARGDITSDEFMERASVLNWTPGSEAWNQGKPRKKRR